MSNPHHSSQYTTEVNGVTYPSTFTYQLLSVPHWNFAENVCLLVLEKSSTISPVPEIVAKNPVKNDPPVHIAVADSQVALLVSRRENSPGSEPGRLGGVGTPLSVMVGQVRPHIKCGVVVEISGVVDVGSGVVMVVDSGVVVDGFSVVVVNSFVVVVLGVVMVDGSEVVMVVGSGVVLVSSSVVVSIFVVLAVVVSHGVFIPHHSSQ